MTKPMVQNELDEMLKPPSETEVEQALARFAAAVGRHYGDRLKGLYLFGSRARGDHQADSDADVAVVLTDGEWVPWQERWTLNRLAYEARLFSGVAIQPWPFSAARWRAGDPDTMTALVESARRDAVPIRVMQ